MSDDRAPAPGDVAARSHWKRLTPADLARVAHIADVAHPNQPERPEVTAEKLRLFPAGCAKLVRGDATVGYGIAHPWRQRDIPPLDSFLGALPAEADCLYMHDVAILPAARGGRAARVYVDLLKGLAHAEGLTAIACVSVYGTVGLWGTMGFRAVPDAALADKLASYGPSATYMVAAL